MIKNVRRVHKEYVDLESKIKRKYKKAFGKVPSQSMVSRIIARLYVNKRVVMKKKKRKCEFCLK